MFSDETKARVKAAFQKLKENGFNFADETEEAKAEATKKEEVNFISAMLEDGTEIHTDAEEWAEGVNAYVLNAEGEKVDLPTGDYTLEGGATLSVEDGVVTAVGEAAAVEEEMSEEEKPEEKKEETETVEQSEELPAEFKAHIDTVAEGLRTEFADQLKAKDEEIETIKTELAEKTAELEKVKAEFEHEGLPRAAEPVKQITMKDVRAATSTKERVRLLSQMNSNN